MRVFLSDAIDASDAGLVFIWVFGIAPYWGIDAQHRFEPRSQRRNASLEPDEATHRHCENP
jgi:hypothetical protein